jgi:trk system potassium uptake protein TrkA
MAKKEFGIIGLGNFGYYVGKSLVEMGHTVVGVDIDQAKVRQAQEMLTKVFEANATDKVALEQLGIAEMGNVVVSVGKSMEASILIALHLKEIGAPKVWVKAISEEHEIVLKKLGVEEVVFPERFAAQGLARKLVVPGVVDYLSLAEGVLVRELEVTKWAGKTLRELNLTNTYELQVVAIKPLRKEHFNFIPKADRTLQAGDVLLILGEEEKLSQIMA